MGRDKALVKFRGQPLIANALNILREAGLPAAIAGGNPSLASYAPLVPDPTSGLGPLSGICTALASTHARYVVFVSVDQPLLPPSLLQSLLQHAQSSGCPVVLASLAEFAQTFPAVVDRALLPTLASELGAGRAGCFSAFQAATSSFRQTVKIISSESLVLDAPSSQVKSLPAASWFLNINSEDDLRSAEELYPPASRKP
jgi:molybdenum cofactor guanylyltransferase